MDKEWNAGLGSFSRLPLEARRRIYDLLMRDDCSEHFHRTFHELRFKDHRILLIDEDTRYDRYEARIYDYRLHNGDCGNQCHTSRSLRLQHTSSTLRNEYRDNLLASTCFNFMSPAGAVGFLTSLTPHEKLQVRRLTLNISERDYFAGPRANVGYDNYLQWKWVCSAVPPNLTSVTIDTMSRWIPMHWMKIHGPNFDLDTKPLIEVFVKLQCALLTVEMMCKEVKHRAPKAKFRLGLYDPNYSPFYHAVLAEYY